MKRLSFVSLFSLIILLFLPILLFSAPSVYGQSERATITVTDHAILAVTPDIVSFDIEVSGEDSTANGAKAEHDLKARSVLETLAELGVPAENVRTEHIFLSDQYFHAVGGTVHKCSQMLEITLKDIDGWEYVLQRAFDAGANGVTRIEFSTSERDDLQLILHEMAFNRALEKADRLARASGLRVGGIIDMNDGQGDMAMYIRASGQRDVAATQIESPADFLARGRISSPGQIELRATVQITCTLIKP